MKKLFSLFCVVLPLVFMFCIVTSSGVASAKSLPAAPQSHSATTSLAIAAPGRQIDSSQSPQLALQSYQLAARKAMEKANVTNPAAVSPDVSYVCKTITYNSQSGTLCITLYLACVGPACVPYAVSLDFSQALLDKLATNGTAAAAFIVSVISFVFPPLGGFAGIISSFLAYALGSLDNYGRGSCGGHGAGIYINFVPPWDSIHCS